MSNDSTHYDEERGSNRVDSFLLETLGLLFPYGNATLTFIAMTVWSFFVDIRDIGIVISLRLMTIILIGHESSDSPKISCCS